jgi:hypothetical protein
LIIVSGQIQNQPCAVSAAGGQLQITSPPTRLIRMGF